MMKYLLALLFGAALSAAAMAQQVPHPAPMSLPKTNIELKSINGGINLRAARLGFTTPGDGGYAEYNWSASNCTAADDGAQVQPNSGSGCWVADFSGQKPTPMIWGAAGNGTTNDTVKVQAAVNALARQTLYIGPHRYCIGAPGLIIQKPVTIQGDTPGNRYQAPTSDQYGFTACATNIELLKFTSDGMTNTASGSVLRDVFVEAGSAGANTSGAAVVWNPTTSTKMENVRINRACIAVDIQSANSLVMDHVDIMSFVPGGDVSVDPPQNCGGIRVGSATTLAATVDVRITNTTSNVRGGFGILIEDAGGLSLGPGVDFLYAVNGTVIKPRLASQHVAWLYANSAALSDSTCSTGLLIDTTSGTNRITGLHFNQTWTATTGNTPPGCSGSGVYIGNGGGGVVKGVHFVGHRAYANGTEGFLVKTGVSDITIDNSEICANGTVKVNVPGDNYNGIHLDPGAAGVAIRNNRISASCVVASAFEGLQATGIFLAGTNGDLTIVGNDLRGNVSAGLAGTSLLTGQNVIRANTGDDNVVPSIAAAASIAMPLGTNIAITGGAAISAMTGMWDGRAVNLVATGVGTSFVQSASVCNAKTMVQFEQVLAYQMPGTACVYIR